LPFIVRRSIHAVSAETKFTHLFSRRVGSHVIAIVSPLNGETRTTVTVVDYMQAVVIVIGNRIDLVNGSNQLHG